MTNHFKNFIEKKGIWNTKRVIFTDYAKRQEVEFIRDNEDYKIQINYFIKDDFKKENYPVKKDAFYKKLSDIVENTIYNKKDYKLTNYIKLETLLAVKFN